MLKNHLEREKNLNNVNQIIFLKPLNELLDSEVLSKYLTFNDFFDF